MQLSCNFPQFLRLPIYPRSCYMRCSVMISRCSGTHLTLLPVVQFRMQDIQGRMQDEDSPLNQTGLCLLSLGMKVIHTSPSGKITDLNLDGGGVRGLSTLLIIK